MEVFELDLVSVGFFTGILVAVLESVLIGVDPVFLTVPVGVAPPWPPVVFVSTFCKLSLVKPCAGEVADCFLVSSVIAPLVGVTLEAAALSVVF